MGSHDATDLGLFPLGLVALPGELVPLHIFEPRYRALVADCALEARPFVIALSNDDQVAEVGCVVWLDGLIRRFADGRMNVVVRGEERVRLTLRGAQRPYLTTGVAPIPDTQDSPDPALAESVRERWRRLTKAVAGAAAEPDRRGTPLSYAVAGALDLDAPVKQELLEQVSERLRLERLGAILDTALAGLDRQAVAESRAHTNGKVTLD